MSILQAIWQADGAFPSGSFAFSYGIEGFVALRGKVSPVEMGELTSAILRQRWATFDRIALLRAFRANGDLVQIAAVAIGMGATKADFDRAIAMHPTAGEELVTFKSPSYRYRNGAKV